MARVETTPAFTNRVAGMMRLLELERAYIIFALIYLPVAWLFYNQSALERALLAVYTIVMIVVGLILVGRFFVYLAIQASEHSGKFGGVLLRYVVNFLIPILSFKVYGHVFMVLLPPDRHQGIVCDLVRLAGQLYFQVFQVQHMLNVVMLGSAAAVFVFTLWSVTQAPRK